MKDDKFYIKHILESVSNIEQFSKELTKTSFEKDRLRQSAIIREFEIIGEASKNISPDTKRKYEKIPWNEIAGFRDKLIHHYFGVNLKRVWNIVKVDLPNLKKEMGKIKL
jgi:uncharacterized protein with HEPN domain